MVLPVEAIPTPAQVHARIARRPVFTAVSQPSIADVETLIAGKAAEVDVEVTEGFVLPVDLVEYVRATIAFGAAADVEQTYFPEQQLGDDGNARALTATYLRMLERLRVKLDEVDGGTSGGTEAFTIRPAYVAPTLLP
jgi:hypothetical protein